MKRINPASQYQKTVSRIKDIEPGAVFVSDEIDFTDKSILRIHVLLLV